MDAILVPVEVDPHMSLVLIGRSHHPQGLSFFVLAGILYGLIRC